MLVAGWRRGKARTEYGIDDVICGLQRGGKIVYKGDFKIFQLLGESLLTNQRGSTQGQEHHHKFELVTQTTASTRGAVVINKISVSAAQYHNG